MRRLYCTAAILIMFFTSCAQQSTIHKQANLKITPNTNLTVASDTTIEKPYHISEAIDSVVVIETIYYKIIPYTEVDKLTGKTINKIYREKRMMSGTGVYMGDGVILTARHVVGEPSQMSNPETQYRITTSHNPKRPHAATVLYYSVKKDLALIKIVGVIPTELKPVKYNANPDTKVGDDVYLIGSPLGHDFSMSKGILSAVRNVNNSLVTCHMFQVDAAMNSGNSGGPLINSKGELLGIASFIVADEVGAWRGIGYCSSIKEINWLFVSYFSFVKKQKTKKKVDTSYLEEREKAKQEALEKAEKKLTEERK